MDFPQGCLAFGLLFANLKFDPAMGVPTRTLVVDYHNGVLAVSSDCSMVGVFDENSELHLYQSTRRARLTRRVLFLDYIIRRVDNGHMVGSFLVTDERPVFDMKFNNVYMTTMRNWRNGWDKTRSKRILKFSIR